MTRLEAAESKPAIMWSHEALLEAAQAVLIEELSVGEVDLEPGMDMPTAAVMLARKCSEYLKDEHNQPYNELYEKVLRVMMGDRDGKTVPNSVPVDIDTADYFRGRIGSMGY